jgi:ABC-2 type transport system ATP-binding protein
MNEGVGNGMHNERSAGLAIEVRNLEKSYRGGVKALNGLSFQVASGAIFGLLGPNGAGKSTAVKILATLSRPNSGEARVAGYDLLREPDKVRHAIGVVAQRSGVDREATGRENLTLQGQIYGLRGAALKARVSELLERFTLTDAADRVLTGYSGGMQRRLDVAMGLVHRPQVLFLDEPTTGLDPEVRTAMWEEIARLAKEEGLTILLTTHYLEEADSLCDRVAIVDKGAVVVEGTPEQLKAELSGDAILIELAAAEMNGRVLHALDGLGGLREVALDGRRLRARAERGATAVPQVLTALESAGVGVAAVTVSRPSLDDVYLRYAGRSFGDADKGEAA